jgi:PncC family amidohydrolase
VSQPGAEGWEVRIVVLGSESPQRHAPQPHPPQPHPPRAHQVAADGAGQGSAGQDAYELAGQVLARLRAGGHTVAVAESLTGGLVAAALTDVPGSSVAFRGGVVAYATELTALLLGVDRGMLARHGAVYAPVAAAMAAGVRTRLGATYGVATTGVAGPDPADGQPVGTAHIAVSAADDTVVRTIALTGNRHQIRRLSVEHALGLLLGRLREETG